MARGIELDWVVIRVSPLRRALAIVILCLVAAGAVAFVYLRLHLPPEALARRAIEHATTAHQRASTEEIPESWRSELEQAEAQLEAARQAYAEERWEAARSEAEDASSRFESLLGAGSQELVGVGQFFSLEGKISVQRAGRAEWIPAHSRMPVFNGDFVKTGRDGSAEILFADGSLYRIAPNSLLEIHHESPSEEEPSAVKMVVGRINVYTSGAGSTVTTETTETHIDRDSRVAVDVDSEERQTVVEAFQGGAVVRNPHGQEVAIASRERVAATADGRLSEKRQIPNPPQPIEPQNNVGFDLATHPFIDLRWSRPPAPAKVHLQVSRSRRFLEGLVDVDAPALYRDRARLKAVHAGTYFWRVATVAGDDLRSEWSQVRRFRIFSPTNQPLLEDHTPPELTIKPTQQLGHMVIVEGDTEVGAAVTVNGEAVEMDGAGHFRKAVELSQEGWNELVVAAVDPSGNRSERRERVYVEVF